MFQNIHERERVVKKLKKNQKDMKYSVRGLALQAIDNRAGSDRPMSTKPLCWAKPNLSTGFCYRVFFNFLLWV